MSSDHKNHALVIGASGLIGWAVVNELLSSSSSSFSHITALVNRPLKLEDSFWPAETADGPRISLVSGVDLSSSDEEFENGLKDKVLNLESVSHVFYFAFKSDLDPINETTLNVAMMRRLILAISNLSSNFTSFVYPGGTRGYGIYRPGGIFTAPLTEDLVDTLPPDYAATVAYPHYRALLTAESKGKKWTWCELCPDAIIGFTPNGSGFSLAGHWAVYLYCWKLIYGEGAEVPYPGTKQGYESLYSETSSGTLARVGIYAALNPEKLAGKIVNVADSVTPGSMSERWPQIVKWFGLKGVGPKEGASVEDQKPGEFVKENKEKLVEAGAKGVEIWNSEQLDSYGYWLTFDRQLSLKRLREARFEEEKGPQEGWWEAFEMFKKAGMIQ
ncbi:hypothetical protein K505DRAFT_311066 [Melanomma pulvis-pyrius CBS 109.77]|uniref:PRISE-like Rossmann-fold domain-containing protein n=1 Tax=Melanomma pulvis-pyrius CBS 109.77 TaxID=1314802 RepID=A0A6A6X3B5_9PLEO|nr:hypothetical protein K505DRAFT_311066 [Melanomma pulvis-pyrius CBS 109.77]